MNCMDHRKSGGVSYSPRTYEKIHAVQTTLSSPAALLTISLLGLIGTPLSFYSSIPGSSPASFLQALVNAWDGLLSISFFPVLTLCLMVSFLFARSAANERQHLREKFTRKSSDHMIVEKTIRKAERYGINLRSRSVRFHCIALFITACFCILIGVVGPWALILPSWFWHPFLWGSYNVYWPSKLAPAMQGLCVDYSLEESNGRLPLCLDSESWDTLSTGALSSSSTADVEAVLEGIAYGKQHSGGIVISVLARDVVDFIAPLRQNIESLVPFFSNVAVVVFENDSKDGSREAFRRWGQVVKGYSVDLIECDDASECRFGKIHRDDARDFSHSSAVGDMHKYRQRVVDHINTSPKYVNFSHIIVLDIDLGVSLSPFGVLHTLGTMPDNPVASAGRQPWPVSFGSLVTPYDFSAFRPYVTKENARMLELQQRFCNLMPPGDRWRNECDALSPIQMIQVLAHDRVNTDFVRVESAFNGAVMYPLKLIRDSHAKYDAGEDGQRCEHVGFHISLKRPMYMNKKWDMHLSPTIPGGPNGARAKKTTLRILFEPRLSWTVTLLHVVFTAIFVWSAMTLGVFFVYPSIFQGKLEQQWTNAFGHQKHGRKRISETVKII